MCSLSGLPYEASTKTGSGARMDGGSAPTAFGITARHSLTSHSEDGEVAVPREVRWADRAQARVCSVAGWPNPPENKDCHASQIVTQHRVDRSCNSAVTATDTTTDSQGSYGIGPHGRLNLAIPPQLTQYIPFPPHPIPPALQSPVRLERETTQRDQMPHLSGRVLASIQIHISCVEALGGRYTGRGLEFCWCCARC